MSDTHPDRADTPRPAPPSEERRVDSAAPTGAPAVVRGGAAARDEEPESEGDELVGQTLAARYRIETLLGSGGMGSVYRAEHVHMRKAVAIKVLHREMTYLPEVVARFEREAVAAARIEHPNVAAATDFGRLEDGSFYLVLEYVEGRSLSQLIRERGTLPVELALRITRHIVSALSAAHAAGIVHRDLKPDNVMLVEKDGDPFFVKVLDFGIAKVQTADAKDQLTQLGSVFGTPEYMAPEQAAGTPVDARADLYTVGILLYEMLCGATPFGDEDLVVVLTRQMTMDPPPLPAGVDPGVNDLVMRLLHKDPDARIQSADECVASIDALLAQSLTPSPVSIGAPMSRAQVEYGDTVLSMANPALGMPPGPAVDASPPARSTLDDALARLREQLPALRRTVRVGGQPVPVWVLIAAFGVLVFGAVFVVGGLAMASRDGGSSAGGVTGLVGGSSERKLPDDVRELVARATKGDRSAIAQLEARPEEERSAAEWRALGRGFALIDNPKASLTAYGKALALDPKAVKDPLLVADVRKAASKPDTAEQALTLAAGSLGAVGADLIYDVWSEQRGKKSGAAISKRAKELLDSPTLQTKASPALQVALELSSARGCAAIKAVLPRAVQYADKRSLTKLRMLSARRGCGFLGMGDCYSCLRRGDDLKKAIDKAESTAAPAFD